MSIFSAEQVKCLQRLAMDLSNLRTEIENLVDVVKADNEDHEEDDDWSLLADIQSELEGCELDLDNLLSRIAPKTSESQP